MGAKPALILLFSGKRKSGKDFITDLLHERLDSTSSVIIRLSGPIKQQFADDHGLEYNHLLAASNYKEKYRLQMIAWSEAKRAQDTGFFIRAAIQMYQGAQYPVWIVSDMRRRSDLAWFEKHYSGCLYTVRVTASPEARAQRGWYFTTGVDDAESECDLDSVSSWNLVVDNSGEKEAVEEALNLLQALCQSRLALSSQALSPASKSESLPN